MTLPKTKPREARIALQSPEKAGTEGSQSKSYLIKPVRSWSNLFRRMTMLRPIRKHYAPKLKVKTCFIFLLQMVMGPFDVETPHQYFTIGTPQTQGFPSARCLYSEEPSKYCRLWLYCDSTAREILSQRSGQLSLSAFGLSQSNDPFTKHRSWSV